MKTKILLEPENEIILLSDVDINSTLVGVHFENDQRAFVQIIDFDNSFVTARFQYSKWNSALTTFKSLDDLIERTNIKGLYTFDTPAELGTWLMEEYI